MSVDSLSGGNRLAIRRGASITLIPMTTVEFVAARRTQSVVYTGTQSFVVGEPLGTLAPRLGGGEFLRIHRSALVAIAQVRHVHCDDRGRHHVTLASGQTLPVSRQRDADVLSTLLVGEVRWSGISITPGKRLACGLPRRISLVAPEGIESAHGARNHICLYVDGDRIMVKSSLGDLLRAASAVLLQIHRSTLVNRGCVVGLERSRAGSYTLVLRSGRRLPVGARYRRAVSDLFKDVV